MKKSYLKILTLLLFACTLNACTADEDFPELTDETLLKDLRIVEMNPQASGPIWDDTEENYECQKWDCGMRTTYACFHSAKELAQSNYDIFIEEIPLVDWKNQTLVIIRTFMGNGINLRKCNVYNKAGKYVVECFIDSDFTCIMDDVSLGIVLNQKNVSAKDIKLKLIGDGIYQ